MKAQPHRILELRIHGIKNTPPSEMLGVDKSDLRLYQGDENGGFWIATSLPDPDPDDHSPDPVIPPPGVRREAYSWGALARYGGGALVIIGQFFVQLAWLLILPFGLTNSAYWTRRIPMQKTGGEWRGGVGVASLRVFALGLTLLYVCALGSVSLDLIGTQCVVAATACPALPPAVMDFLTNSFMAQRGRQMAVLSLVPIVGILVLFIVSRSERVRYEASIFNTVGRMRRSRVSDEHRPLRVEGFWQQSRVGAPSEWLHVAGALFLVTLLLAWDRVFAELPGCAQLQSFVRNACVSQLFDADRGLWYFSLVGILAIVGLVVVVWRIARFSDTVTDSRSGRRWGGAKATESGRQADVAEFLRSTQDRRETVSATIILIAIVVYLGVGVLLFVSGRYALAASPADAFLGLVSAPGIIIGVLLAICLSALGWRRGVPHGLSIALMFVSGLAFLAGVSQGPEHLDGPPGQWQWLWYLVAGVFAGAQLLLVFAWPRWRKTVHRFRSEGWAGAGPGVLMLLALGATMILSTLLVLGFQTWLASGTPACGCTPATPVVLRAPIAYINFGDVLPLVTAALLLFVGVVVLLRMRWLPLLTTPRTVGGRRPLLEPTESYANGRVERATTTERLATKILRARRSAALFHRGEPILGVLAGLLALAFIASLAVSKTHFFVWIGSFAGPVLGLIAVSAIVVIAENAATTKDRPIGVMWDLMCFLPRAGHPFGPPCYAERVVPELRDRVGDWLSHDARPPASVRSTEALEAWRERVQDAALTADRANKVILSAHSLGAVLAVACLFTLRPDADGRLHNVGLLTYGTQLRVYFGRFFPELFGPDVLGTPRQRPPSLGKADPWFRQVVDDLGLDRAATGDDGSPTPDESPDPTLVQLLTHDDVTAWFSLWRRTDYLGFPVYSNAPNPVDAGADEFGPSRYLVKVATHPDYQYTPQYAANLERMIRVLSRAKPRRPGWGVFGRR